MSFRMEMNPRTFAEISRTSSAMLSRPKLVSLDRRISRIVVTWVSERRNTSP
ncbi:hypothetical protein D3C71_2243390 [compost metagenome]